MKEIGEIAETIQSMLDGAETMEEIHKALSAIAFTVGGMVCHFEQDNRSEVLINLTQAMGLGLQATAKSIGEPSDIEIVVGNREVS